MLDLTLLGHAQTLARHGNYARAASELYMSQPTLSRHIAALEHTLGVRLFDRGRKRVEPTAYGRLLLERGATLTSDAAELMRELRLMQGLEVGELYVGAGIYPAELSLGRAVGGLTAKHPGLRVEVTTGDWRSIINATLTTHLDLSVLELSVVEDEKRLAVEALPRHPGVFFTRPGHPLQSEASPTIEHLSAFPFAGPKLAPRAAGAMAKLLKQGTTDPSSGDYIPPIKVDSIRLAKDAVRASDAVSLAPLAAITAELASGTLVALPFKAPWLYTNYGFVYLVGRSLSPAAQAFMERVRKVEQEIVAEEERLMVTVLEPRRLERRRTEVRRSARNDRRSLPDSRKRA
jgi:DNA-binding transcriptional LysR family regulator